MGKPDIISALDIARPQPKNRRQFIPPKTPRGGEGQKMCLETLNPTTPLRTGQPNPPGKFLKKIPAQNLWGKNVLFFVQSDGFLSSWGSQVQAGSP